MRNVGSGEMFCDCTLCFIFSISLFLRLFSFCHHLSTYTTPMSATTSTVSLLLTVRTKWGGVCTDSGGVSFCMSLCVQLREE